MRKAIYKSYAGRREMPPVRFQHVVAEKVPGELQSGHQFGGVGHRTTRLGTQKIR